MARQKGKINTAKSKTVTPITRAQEYIALPLSRLPLQRVQLEYITVLCERLANKVDEMGLSQENMLPSLAAGCVAFVLKRCEVLDVPMTKIAEVCEISIATLQKCLRRLEIYSSELEEILR